MNSNKKDEALAYDLICNFFMVAMNSFRFDSVLLPYPSKYLDRATQVKDIDKLREIASKIPSVVDIFKNGVSNLDSQELFNWITYTPFKLVYHDKSKFNLIKELTKQELNTSVPDHIFEVIHPEQHELKFSALKNGFETIYAYHGSRIENFHSILHHGLVSHLNKTAMFGFGTYFSSELSVSLLYSSSCVGWNKSLLGSHFSCVAVCEIIDHPTVKSHANEGSAKTYEDTIGGRVPEKYYIVENNELVKVCYLLIYVVSERSTSLKWWQKHRFLLVMLSYLVLLIIVGLSNNTSLRKVFSWIFQEN